MIGASVIIPTAIGIATSFLLSLFKNPEEQKAGPANEQKPKSDFGQPIPTVEGKYVVGGNLHAPRNQNIRTEVNTEERGGKGGGGQEVETREYFGDASWKLARCPVSETYPDLRYSLRKVWFNGHLWLNFDSEDSEELEKSLERFNDYCEFKPGTANQTPSPFIINEDYAIEGKAPAWPAEAMFMVKDVPLKEFGNSLPTMKAEIGLAISTGANPTEDTLIEPLLSDVVTRICLDAGLSLSDIDVSELSNKGDRVRGFLIPQNGEPYRKAIEELGEYFLFFPCEINGKIHFRYYDRSHTTAIHIPKEDLATHEFGDETPELYIEEEDDPFELPSKISLSFSDVNKEYEKNNVIIVRQARQQANTESISLPLALTEGEAGSAARRLIHQLWKQGRKQTKLFLPFEYYNLIFPGDIVKVNINERDEYLQIQEIKYGANFIIEINCIPYQGEVLLTGSATGGEISYNLSTYLSSQTSTSTSTNEYEEGIGGFQKREGRIKNPGEAIPKIIDSPIRNSIDTELGIYVAITGGTKDWTNGNLYASQDNGITWDRIKTLKTRSIYGICENSDSINITPPNYLDGNPIIDETTTLILKTFKGKLESVPQEVFDRGESRLWIGDDAIAYGGELIDFRDASLIEETSTYRTYEVSHLRRGVKTEYQVDKHGATEDFILLRGNGAYAARPEGLQSDIGKQIIYKAIGPGQTLTSVTTSTTHTFKGRGAYPLAVFNIQAKEDGPNIIISWESRNKDIEEFYEIQITETDGTPIETLSSKSPNIIWNQTRNNDGTNFDFNTIIWQLSSIAGEPSSIPGYYRGYPSKTTPTPVGTIQYSDEKDNNTIRYNPAQGDTKKFINEFPEISSLTGTETFLVDIGEGNYNKTNLTAINENVETDSIKYPSTQGTGGMLISEFPSTTNPIGSDKILIEVGTEYNYTELQNIDFAAFSGTTDDITEGSNNLYFTNARVDTRLSNLKLNAIGNFNDTGGNSPSDGYVVAWDDANNIYKPQSIGNLNFILGDLTNVNTSNKSDGYALQWDSSNNEFILAAPSLTAASTDDISEGSNNLYYENSRVDNYVKSNIKPQDLYRVDESNLNDRAILIYDTSGTINYWRMEVLSDTQISSTDDVPEGSFNLYYTDSRVDSRIGNAWLTDLRNDFYINNLKDVDDSGKATGDALIWDGSNYVPGNPNQGINMEDLGNTNIDSSNLTSGQLLVWDGNSWDNKDPTDITNLGDIDNVNISNGYNRFLFRSSYSGDWNSTNLFDSKGDILVGNGGTSFVNLPIGADGQIIIADSNQSEGLRWGTPEPAYLSVQTISANYTIQSLDHASIFRINDNLTISLPTDLNPGFYFYARLEDSGLTLDLSSNGTIEGINQITVNKEQIKVVYQGDNVWLSTKISSADLGDFSTDDISEGTNNLYYTDSRVDTRISQTLSNTNIDDFNDITFNSLSNGQFLYRESNEWINKNFSSIFSSEFLTNFQNSEIGSLLNVEGTTPNDGDILEYVASTSIFQLISLAARIDTILSNKNIESFNNVEISSPNDGDVLTYNESTGKWEPQENTDSGTSTSSDITDIWLFGGM